MLHGRNHVGSNCLDSTLFLYICAEIVCPDAINIAYTNDHALLVIQDSVSGEITSFFETTFRSNLDKVTPSAICWMNYAQFAHLLKDINVLQKSSLNFFN